MREERPSKGEERVHKDTRLRKTPVILLTFKLAFKVKAVYSLRAALYIVKLLMLLHKLSTAAA
jgi:hypothetical protein